MSLGEVNYSNPIQYLFFIFYHICFGGILGGTSNSFLMFLEVTHCFVLH